MTACSELADLADHLGSRPPRDLLVELGQRVAGIPRSGPLVLPTLFGGGRTRLRGGGFRPELRDRSAGQTRHFAGVARAVTVLGADRTRWASEHLRRDRPGSPDALLTDLAVEFAAALLDGTLAPADAGAWIRRRVCDDLSPAEPLRRSRRYRRSKRWLRRRSSSAPGSGSPGPR